MCIETRDVIGWWTLDALAIGPTLFSSVVYFSGVKRLWRAVGRGRGVRPWEVAAFAAGQLALLLALVSPLDRLSDILFSAHMTQHELIMVVAPPLVVLGRPVVAAMWALPLATRVRVGRALRRPAVARAWRLVSAPPLALVVHALIVWAWHVPGWFEAALRSEAVHALQHATFFASATLFWWAVVRGRYGRAGYGLAVVFVFATAMHTSILGALLTVSSKLWYPLYAARAAPFGVDATEDQSLAGLVMWVPAGTLFVLAVVALFAAWLGEASRRVAAAERRRAAS